MIDVCRDDGASGSHFLTDKFRCDVVRNPGSECFSLFFLVFFPYLVCQLILPDGDVFHFRRNDALAGVVHLGDLATFLGNPRMRVDVLKAEGIEAFVCLAHSSVFRAQPVQLSGILSFFNPVFPESGQPFFEVYRVLGIRVRPGGVVNNDIFVFYFRPVQVYGRRQFDFPHRNFQVRAGALNINLFGTG